MHSSFTYAIRPEYIRDASEGWQIIRFALCGPQADEIAWELPGTGRRSVARGVQARTELSNRARELAFYRALAILQEATGVTVPFIERASYGLVRRVVRAARGVTRGVLTPRLRIARLELKPGVEADELLSQTTHGNAVSLTSLRQKFPLSLPGLELDLGPVLHFMPSVRLRHEADTIVAEPAGDDLAVEAYLRWTDLAVSRRDDAVVVGPPGEIPIALLK
jgi:hypothetical protein